MHLADAFIQSDLHCIQVSTFLSALAFPGNRTHDLGVAGAMLYQLSYRKAVYLMATRWRRHSVLQRNIRVFRCKDAFCVNSPLEVLYCLLCFIVILLTFDTPT